MDFPKGYALFVHMQPAPDGSGHLREDFYWYVSIRLLLLSIIYA
jgi:hypothetical protein